MVNQVFAMISSWCLVITQSDAVAGVILMVDPTTEACEVNVDEQQTSSNSPPKKIRRYALNVSDRLYDRIDRTTRELRQNTDRRIDKSKWIIQSIREKLARDHHVTKQKGFLRMKSIQVNLPEELAQELHKNIEEIRKLTGKGSLKTWIVDAIEEKFANDSE